MTVIDGLARATFEAAWPCPPDLHPDTRWARLDGPAQDLWRRAATGCLNAIAADPDARSLLTHVAANSDPLDLP